MKDTRSAFLTFLVVLVAMLAAPANAIPVVGQAVQGVGDSTSTGNQNADGTIDFYIPLNGSEVYGDTSGGGTGGLSSDSCTVGSSVEPCSGGTLDMFLFYDMPEAGDADVQFDFVDLDLAGVNDPWFFLESLKIVDPDGNTLTFSLVDLLDGSNRGSQSLGFDLGVDGSFYLHLTFTSDFHPNTRPGTYRNSVESLHETATTSVPEPGTLALFGTGLLLLGFSRRRKPAVT